MTEEIDSVKLPVTLFSRTITQYLVLGTINIPNEYE